MDPPPVFYPIWLLDPAPLVDCVKRIARAGFDGVSFAAAPVNDPRRLDVLTPVQADALRQSLGAAGLDRTLHLLSDCYFAGEPHWSDALVRRVQQSIEACVRALAVPGLRPLVVSLDPICLPPGPQGALEPDLIVKMLSFLADLSHRYNMRPAIENWPKPGVGTPEALGRLISQAPGEVAILLDLGHLHMALSGGWCSRRSPADFVRALPAPVLEVHLHDNHGAVDEHLPPGEGTADLVGTLAALIAGGLDGPVTLECDLRPPGRPGLSEAAGRARQLIAEAAHRSAHARSDL